jgi:hypothetical protein
MTQTPPDMKIRLSAILRQQVEDAAKSNNRTLNSEIVSRLERTFREDVERTDKALKAIQASPTIRLEKRLIAVEAELQGEIDALKERVHALELNGRKRT